MSELQQEVVEPRKNDIRRGPLVQVGFSLVSASARCKRVLHASLDYLSEHVIGSCLTAGVWLIALSEARKDRCVRLWVSTGVARSETIKKVRFRCTDLSCYFFSGWYAVVLVVFRTMSQVRASHVRPGQTATVFADSCSSEKLTEGRWSLVDAKC